MRQIGLKDDRYNSIFTRLAIIVKFNRFELGVYYGAQKQYKLERWRMKINPNCCSACNNKHQHVHNVASDWKCTNITNHKVCCERTLPMTCLIRGTRVGRRWCSKAFLTLPDIVGPIRPSLCTTSRFQASAVRYIPPGTALRNPEFGGLRCTVRS